MRQNRWFQIHALPAENTVSACIERSSGVQKEEPKELKKSPLMVQKMPKAVEKRGVRRR